MSRAASALTDALQDDPLMRFVFPDRDHRRQSVAWLYERTLRYGLRNGRVDFAEDARGAAVWLPPGHEAMKFLGMLRAGFVAAPFRIGIRSLLRLGRYRKTKQLLRREALSVPHWYLVVVGVAPSLQGRGLGQALLRPVLSLADQQRCPCCLETLEESNLPFFEKRGFRVRAQGAIRGAQTRVWSMVREPSGGGCHLSR
jgi:ribosomal protein S18 acetylase RimI-like enzyme